MIEHLGSQNEPSSWQKLRIIWNQPNILGLPARILCALWLVSYTAILGFSFATITSLAAGPTLGFIFPVLGAAASCGFLTYKLRFNPHVENSINPPTLRSITLPRPFDRYSLPYCRAPRSTGTRHAGQDRSPAAVSRVRG